MIRILNRDTSMFSLRKKSTLSLKFIKKTNIDIYTGYKYMSVIRIKSVMGHPVL